jgi:hypothetical protein
MGSGEDRGAEKRVDAGNAGVGGNKEGADARLYHLRVIAEFVGGWESQIETLKYATNRILDLPGEPCSIPGVELEALHGTDRSDR